MTHLATKGPTLDSHLATKGPTLGSRVAAGVAAAAGVAGVEARSESKTGNKAWLRRRPRRQMHEATVPGAIIWTPRSRPSFELTV